MLSDDCVADPSHQYHSHDDPRTDTGRRLADGWPATLSFRDGIIAIEDDARAPLVAALEDVLAWFEAEAAHPRPDPRNAMWGQADMIRAALSRENQP